MDLHSVQDLLLYFPRAYEDLSQMHTVDSAPLDEKVTIKGVISALKKIRTRYGKTLITAVLTDTEGQSIEVIWFNQVHIMRMLSDGDDVVLTGKVKPNGRKLQFHPYQFEKETDDDLLHAGKLVPVYKEHGPITSLWLREKMPALRPAMSEIKENMPDDLLKEEDLLRRAEAIEALHFPDDNEQTQKAKERMAFEEMFVLQQRVLEEKQAYQSGAIDDRKIPMDIELIKALFASLKFTPTDGQRVAIYEILTDMESGKPMSRLLEGDVGSGKTLVATAVMANTLRHGGQCALMVPTEVLARQHTESIGKTLINFYTYLQQSDVDIPMPHPTVECLTGSVSKGDADAIKQRLAAGTIDLVIGTHALIEDSVQFKNLQLVIVDEQHRFGVAQRDRLKEKGSPHFLSMTATPIPRTLALTAHGHHDLSVLTEKPGNRKPIETKVVSPDDRKTVELFIDQQIDEGRQVFVICPLITQSESDDFREIKSVEAETERLKESFSKRRIAMLHGKLKPGEKDDIMQQFKAKEYDILVSTSVIEVGIDVPNASIMLIEGAERFGLSQLHQFRGRVGRGEHKSYCFLFTTTPQQARSQRLRAMEKHDSGFMLAEIDLQIRGPGELYGFRQSGIPEVKMGGLMNPELVVRARRAAERMLGMRE